MTEWKTVAAFRHEDGIDFSILLERKADYAYFRIRAVGSDDPADGDGEYLFEGLLGVMSLSSALARLAAAITTFCNDEDLPARVQVKASHAEASS